MRLDGEKEAILKRERSIRKQRASFSADDKCSSHVGESRRGLGTGGTARQSKYLGIKFSKPFSHLSILQSKCNVDYRQADDDKQNDVNS